ncbi:C-C chemokine receptor type 5 [Electrophorus electricus]|uniref:G-protein coupled receptors family 1 profile domain-containing protein n=1 Tax=Electrophorus electricus TaxID=8005 RepID=A0A4W4HS30_ELEEL|nr:C-C chemokine receptor type 5 [Electrophorus electricus]
MDVLHPASFNDSYDYSYEDYYNMESEKEYRPCEKHEVRTFSQAFLPAFFSITCVLSFISNLTLITIFIKSKSLRKVFPLNMVTADLLFTLTLPFWAVYAHGEWIFGPHMCKAVTVFYMVGLFSSNLFVGCLTLQKYVCVARVCVGRLSACRKNTLACAAVWLLSILAATPHLSFVEAHEFQGQRICSYNFMHTHGWRIYMRFQMIILGFCGPFLILLFSSCAIFRIMARRTSLPKRSRTLKLVMGFTILFFALWFPYSVVNLLHALQELHIISECVISLHLDLAIQSTECIAFTHVCLNPLAYLLLNQKIWRKLQGKYTTSNYLISVSDSSDDGFSQKDTLELKGLQRFSSPDLDSSCTEQQGHVLPHIT